MGEKNMDTLSSYFWSETFWLPSNLSWKDFENHPGSSIYLPQYSDMLWSFPLGLILLAFRYIFERGVVVHVARWLGVKEKKRELKPQPVLQVWYQLYGNITNSNIESVSKQTDLSIREIERWLRDRKALSKPCVIKKFQECSWKFVFHIFLFTGGLVVLLDKPWFWKIELWWKNWPRIHVANDVYWYYLIELSYYWCLVFSMVTDHKRKDFGQMVVHHVATISLICFSWLINCVTIGTLILFSHDAADFVLPAAKMFKYSGRNELCVACYHVFVVVWFLSRLMYYPCVVLYNCLVRVDVICWSASIGVGLLIVLQVLHLTWSYYIFRAHYETLFKGKMEDSLSDSESD